MSACKNCLKILVCKYNDGHNLYCKEDYKCPHFLDKSIIEKQIPKKPNIHGYREGREVNTISYTCPICNKHIGRENFCKHCGQALDWSDTE